MQDVQTLSANRCTGIKHFDRCLDQIIKDFEEFLSNILEGKTLVESYD